MKKHDNELVGWLIYLLYTIQSHLGSENLSWGNVSIRFAYRQVCGALFFINTWYGKTEVTVDPAMHGMVVLRCIRKQAVQTMKNNH